MRVLHVVQRIRSVLSELLHTSARKRVQICHDTISTSLMLRRLRNHSCWWMMMTSAYASAFLVTVVTWSWSLTVLRWNVNPLDFFTKALPVARHKVLAPFFAVDDDSTDSISIDLRLSSTILFAASLLAPRTKRVCWYHGSVNNTVVLTIVSLKYAVPVEYSA